MTKVERWNRITREAVRAHRDWLFVFGDNIERRGHGGQAAAMRGEPNSLGIATKRAPGMNEDDFFSDQSDEFAIVANDLAKLFAEFKTGRTIIIPMNGIGSGFAQLKTRSPLIHDMINKMLADLETRAANP